jgi:integrase
VDSQTDTYYPAKDMKTMLRKLYKRAVAEGQARTNLAEFVELPPLTETEQKPFIGDEINAMWTAYDNGDLFMRFPLLMIYSGMMPGELLRCTADMIHTDTHEIVGCGLKTKKRKATPLVYPDWLEPLVQDILANVSSKQGRIVGMNVDNFYTEYHAALARAKVRDLPPYSCRHTTATALALAKTAPSVIQEIMRHTKFATTQRYIHPDMQSAHDAVNVLDKGGKE